MNPPRFIPDESDADAARARLSNALILAGAEDRAAFQDVYRLTHGKLYGITLRICGDRQAAEDVLHDVYITIWKRAGLWEPGRSSPITWLAMIARNRAIDWRRAQNDRQTIPIDAAPDISDATPSADAMMLFDEATRRLLYCLESLEPRRRDAIRAAFFDGVTYADLALRNAVPLGTMKSWIRRGLAQLRASLED